MAHDPMKLLQDEHDVISKANGVVSAMDGVWIRDQKLYEQVAGELLSFCVRYSDGFHHEKEETALFPALRASPDFYLQDLLEELEEQHQTFREHAAQVQAALADKNYDAAQSRLRLYFKDLLDHIAVENDELFVMAKSLLRDAHLERMYFQFQDIDRERGGELKKELEGSVERMKASL